MALPCAGLQFCHALRPAADLSWGSSAVSSCDSGAAAVPLITCSAEWSAERRHPQCRHASIESTGQ